MPAQSVFPSLDLSHCQTVPVTPLSGSVRAAVISARAGGWFVDRVTVPASSMLVTVCAGEPATRVSWTMLVSVYPRVGGGTSTTPRLGTSAMSPSWAAALS